MKKNEEKDREERCGGKAKKRVGGQKIRGNSAIRVKEFVSGSPSQTHGISQYTMKRYPETQHED